MQQPIYTLDSLGPNFKYELAPSQFDWIDVSGGNFSDGSNWSFPIPPTSVDTAFFNLGGTYTVNFSESVTNKFLKVITDNVTFDLNGFDYTILATTTIGDTSSDVAEWTVQNGGTLTTTSTDIANLTSSEGSVTLNGPSTVWENTIGLLQIGNKGNATLTIENGASVNSNNTTHIATSVSSRSSVSVGSNSTMSTLGTFFVGISGDATLLIENGGVVNSSGNQNIVAVGNASDSTVTIDNATWNITTSLFLSGNSTTGSFGRSTVTVETDGILDIGTDLLIWNNGNLIVNAGGTFNIGGTLTLNGGRYEFASIPFVDFTSINAISGSMAGRGSDNWFQRCCIVLWIASR